MSLKFAAPLSVLGMLPLPSWSRHLSQPIFKVFEGNTLNLLPVLPRCRKYLRRVSKFLDTWSVCKLTFKLAGSESSIIAASSMWPVLRALFSNEATIETLLLRLGWSRRSRRRWFPHLLAKSRTGIARNQLFAQRRKRLLSLRTSQSVLPHSESTTMAICIAREGNQQPAINQKGHG